MKAIITGRQGCNQDDDHERDENLRQNWDCVRIQCTKVKLINSEWTPGGGGVSIYRAIAEWYGWWA